MHRLTLLITLANLVPAVDAGLLTPVAPQPMATRAVDPAAWQTLATPRPLPDAVAAAVAETVDIPILARNENELAALARELLSAADAPPASTINADTLPAAVADSVDKRNRAGQRRPEPASAMLAALGLVGFMRR